MSCFGDIYSHLYSLKRLEIVLADTQKKKNAENIVFSSILTQWTFRVARRTPEATVYIVHYGVVLVCKLPI
jgi:hypothetical protein